MDNTRTPIRTVPLTELGLTVFKEVLASKETNIGTVNSTTPLEEPVLSHETKKLYDRSE